MGRAMKTGVTVDRKIIHEKSGEMKQSEKE